MNNFNLVLDTIRQHCKEVNVPDQECFGVVQEQMDIKDEYLLHFYLDFLQDLGLITYNDQSKLIILTERGKHTDQLFN